MQQTRPTYEKRLLDNAEALEELYDKSEYHRKIQREKWCKIMYTTRRQEFGEVVK